MRYLRCQSYFFNNFIYYTPPPIGCTSTQEGEGIRWARNGRFSRQWIGVILIFLIMMRTILSRAIGVYRHTKVSVQDGTAAEVEGMENISKLPFYQSFKEGLNLTMQNKLEEANQNFQKALNLLEERRQLLSDHYLHINKKMMANNLSLGRIKAAEDSFYSIIKMKKKYRFQSILVYDDYHTLFRLFLKYNPQKAIVLGKALLTEKETESMSLKHKKEFLFELGNAYFLVGNYADAKSKYSECLDTDPSNELKSRVLNNLGLVCWWQKNPLFPEQVIESQRLKIGNIDNDFKQTREIFLKSLEKSENPIEILDEGEQLRMKQALREEELNVKVDFRHATSVQPIFNLVQYYMNNEPTEKVKIFFWLRALLQVSKASSNDPFFDEAYATMCILNNERQQLEEFVKLALEKYKDKFQQIYYNRLMSLLLGDKDRIEAQKLATRAQELQAKFMKEDPYVFKRKFLSLEELDL